MVANEFIPFYFKTLDAGQSSNTLQTNETIVLGYLCALYDRLKTNKQLLEGNTFFCSSQQITEKTTLTERQIKPILERLGNSKIKLIGYNVPKIGQKRVFKLLKLSNINLKEKLFFPIYTSLIQETSLQASLFIAYIAHLERIKRVCYQQLTSQNIEKYTGLSKFQQQKAAQLLCEKGFLKKVGGANSNVFILTELYISCYPLFENKPKDSQKQQSNVKIANDNFREGANTISEAFKDFVSNAKTNKENDTEKPKRKQTITVQMVGEYINSFKENSLKENYF